MAGRPRTMDDAQVFAGLYGVLSRASAEQLTMAMVADEIGFSPAALHKRFGSKRQLLLAFYDYLIEITAESFAAARNTASSPRRALETVFLQWATEDGDPIRLTNLISFYSRDVADPEFRHRSRQRLALIDREVRQLIADSVAVGEMTSRDPARSSRVLQAAVTGALLMWAVERTGSAADWLRDCFAEILG